MAVAVYTSCPCDYNHTYRHEKIKVYIPQV